LVLTSHYGRGIIDLLLHEATEAPATAIARSSDGLAAVVKKLEVVLDRQVNSLSRLADLTDFELAHIEASEATRNVVICRQEMGPEFVGADDMPEAFRDAVEENLARGVTYHWITEDNAVSRQRERLVRELFPAHDEQITITRLKPETWETLPFALETVFYRQLMQTGAHQVIGFTDVSFAIENHRMWRRLSERYCTNWYDAVEQRLGKEMSGAS
jgi:hypothetical protein